MVVARFRTSFRQSRRTVLVVVALTTLVTFRNLVPLMPGSASGVKIKNVVLANPEGPHCLYLPTAGWGNAVYLALSFGLQAQKAAKMIAESGGIDLRTAAPCDYDGEAPSQHCVNYAFPCIVVDEAGSDTPLSYGQVFSELLVNMHPCPVDFTVYNRTTCPKKAASQEGFHWMKVATVAIDDYQNALQRQQQMTESSLPNMFLLNATFVERAMVRAQARLALTDLVSTDANHTSSNQVCAVQSRFGDYWTRSRHKPKDDRDKRLCKSVDKHDKNAKDRCWDKEARTILGDACPDPTIPLYLATDWSAFARYMCANFRLDDGSDSNVTAAETSNGSEEIRVEDRLNRYNQQGDKRPFASKCPSDNVENRTFNAAASLHLTHIQDVDLGSARGSMTFYEMITDWIVLLLGDGCETRERMISNQQQKSLHHSTFLSSTCYPWELVW